MLLQPSMMGIVMWSSGDQEQKNVFLPLKTKGLSIKPKKQMPTCISKYLEMRSPIVYRNRHFRWNYFSTLCFFMLLKGHILFVFGVFFSQVVGKRRQMDTWMLGDTQRRTVRWVNVYQSSPVAVLQFGCSVGKGFNLPWIPGEVRLTRTWMFIKSHFPDQRQPPMTGLLSHVLVDR